MKSFGLTMAFAILVSLLVSFTLTPMLSARWLEGRRRSGTDAARRRRTRGSSARSIAFYTRDARVVDGAPRRSSPASPCWCCCSSVPLFMVANKNFLPQRRPVGVRGQPARAGRHQPRGDRDHRQPHRHRDPAAARSGLHAGARSPATRRRRRTSAPIYVRLKPIEERERDQFAVMDDVRSEHPAAARVANLRTGVQPVATIGGGGNQNADIQFIDQRARSEEARDVSQAAVVDAVEEGARRRRRRHVAERRQAGAVGAASTGRRRPTSACRSATRPKRCACWSAATR